MASLPIIAEESEVVMAAKLETTTAACKYFLSYFTLLAKVEFSKHRVQLSCTQEAEQSITVETEEFG